DERAGGAGVDVVLDNMGAKYLARNVDALATGGRLVSIGMQGGTKAELDLGTLMRKRASVPATTLRSRSPTRAAQGRCVPRPSAAPPPADGSRRQGRDRRRRPPRRLARRRARRRPADH